MVFLHAVKKSLPPGEFRGAGLRTFSCKSSIEWELRGDLHSSGKERAVHCRDIGTVVRQSLGKLSMNSREVPILRELEGMSYREIAEITGVATGTAMSSLSRARNRLRQILRGGRNGDQAPSSAQLAAVSKSHAIRHAEALGAYRKSLR